MRNNLRGNCGVLRANCVPNTRANTWLERFFDGAELAYAPTSLPVAFWQDENNTYVELDLPGVKETDIDITVEEGTLIIQGERKNEWAGKRYDTRHYGKFEQRITLPNMVDASRVEAKLVSGVLLITCPRSEEAKPRKIPVQPA